MPYVMIKGGLCRDAGGEEGLQRWEQSGSPGSFQKHLEDEQGEGWRAELLL